MTFEQHLVKYLTGSETQETVLQLIQSAKEGHLCMPLNDVSCLSASLWTNGDETNALPKTPLVFHNKNLYLQKNWALESLILQKIVQILKRPALPNNFSHFQTALEKEPLQEAQKKAIQNAFHQNFSIFTGGPGTGKTYTAGCFIRLLAAAHIKKVSFKVAIAAPTGKAAAHLEETLKKQSSDTFKCESTTLHRLLKLQPSRQRLTSEFTIDADLVVVDEASMLDELLFLHLLNAIGPDTRLLLLGDPDQLPPINGGSLFTEIAALIGQKLERSMRMGEGDLFAFSQAIKREDQEALLQTNNETIKWVAYKDMDPIRFLPNALHPVRPDPAFCLIQQQKVRILCALRQGSSGIDELNRQILTYFEQQALSHEWLAIPILITQNDSKQNLYNGTAGTLITQASTKTATAYFQTSEGIRTIPEMALPRYETAFCLSVHKSQGSEFDEVLTLFPKGSECFGKEVLYTAVTRAKKKVTLAIEEGILKEMLHKTSKKRSGFTERFKNILTS